VLVGDTLTVTLSVLKLQVQVHPVFFVAQRTD